MKFRGQSGRTTNATKKTHSLINDYLLEVGEMRFADLETRGTLSKTVHIADLPHILETGNARKEELLLAEYLVLAQKM